MSFLKNLFGKKQKSSLPIGVQFFFDWNQISAGNYANYVRNKLLPYFYPDRISPQIVPFAFFDGDLLGQVNIPYNGPTQERVLHKVKSYIQSVYVMAIFGPWHNISKGPEKVDKELQHQNFSGYLGSTHAIHLNTFQSYAQFASKMGLSLGCMISREEFIKYGWSWMKDDKLRKAGFKPQSG